MADRPELSGNKENSVRAARPCHNAAAGVAEINMALSDYGMAKDF
jgi:hypothetical protein